MPFSVVLLPAPTSIQASNASAKECLSLLAEVSQCDADAKSHPIEAIQERTSSNESQPSWQKTLLAAMVATGGR
jgi:hypothetical protein